MTGSGGRDVLVSFVINASTALGFVLGFALLKNQRVHSRVYFPRWYMKGQDEKIDEFIELGKDKKKATRYINLNIKSYGHMMDWVWNTLRMTEAELLELVGLDSTVLLRVFWLGLKIFVPMMFWGCVVLVPVNKTDNQLRTFQISNSGDNFTFTPIDTLSIANVTDLSKRLWAHLLASWLFTGWTLLMLYFEYDKVERMRYDFIASQKHRPDQFTVLVRQVPKNKNLSVGLRIQEFFRENHPEHYSTHQVLYKANKLTKLINQKASYDSKLERIYQHLAVEPASVRPTTKKGWLRLYGEKVDAVDYYEAEVDRLTEEIFAERKTILSNDNYVMRAGFVSFRSRWGAAVCAQTQQSKDHTKWLTEWAPEPRDVYWDNLSIRYMELNLRRVVIAVIVAACIIFFLIPVGLVQSLANLDSLKKYLPFLKPVMKVGVVKNFIQGYLPGFLMTLFLLLLPPLTVFFTQFEGHVSFSKIEKYAGLKYFFFLVVNVFFGNVLIGSLFEQLKQYIAAPTTVPKAFGNSIPMKSTFFMTYIMVAGWSSCAAELFRLWPLLLYHITNSMFVKTDKERVKLIPATPAQLNIVLPHLGLYFLIGLVYAVISPLIMPFICVYFAFGYLVYRNQVINVYEPKYESAASFWPFVHRNIIIALIVKHITLIGLFAVKKAVASTPFLLPLPIITIFFQLYCSQRFYPAFRNYPLQEARRKDNSDQEVDVKKFLEAAYLHPSIKLAVIARDAEEEPVIKYGTTPGEGLEDIDSEKIKNGPAPSSGPEDVPSDSQRSEVPGNDINLVPLRPSSNGDVLCHTSPYSHTASQRTHRRVSSSASGSYGSSHRLPTGDSPTYFDANGSLLSPSTSKGSSQRVQLEGYSSLPADGSFSHSYDPLRSSSFRGLDGADRDKGKGTSNSGAQGYEGDAVLPTGAGDDSLQGVPLTPGGNRVLPNGMGPLGHEEP